MNKKQPSPAKRHHVISQFYLKGFMNDSWYFLLDIKTGSITHENRNNLRNRCVKKHFNTIDIPGIREDYLEYKFSKLEERAAQAIKNIENTKRFYGESRSWVLWLIAYFMRSPERRSALNSSVNQLG